MMRLVRRNLVCLRRADLNFAYPPASCLLERGRSLADRKRWRAIVNVWLRSHLAPLSSEGTGDCLSRSDKPRLRTGENL